MCFGTNNMMPLSRYNIVKYILATFPDEELDPVAIKEHFLKVSRIFGKNHTLPMELVKGLARTHASNHALLEILPSFIAPLKTDHEDRRESWICRRDAGNMRVRDEIRMKRLEEKELARKKMDEEYELNTKHQQPLYDQMFEIAVQKRNNELDTILHY